MRERGNTKYSKSYCKWCHYRRNKFRKHIYGVIILYERTVFFSQGCSCLVYSYKQLFRISALMCEFKDFCGISQTETYKAHMCDETRIPFAGFACCINDIFQCLLSLRRVMSLFHSHTERRTRKIITVQEQDKYRRDAPVMTYTCISLSPISFQQ